MPETEPWVKRAAALLMKGCGIRETARAVQRRDDTVRERLAELLERAGA